MPPAPRFLINQCISEVLILFLDLFDVFFESIDLCFSVFEYSSQRSQLFDTFSSNFPSTPSSHSSFNSDSGDYVFCCRATFPCSFRRRCNNLLMCHFAFATAHFKYQISTKCNQSSGVFSINLHYRSAIYVFHVCDEHSNQTWPISLYAVILA